jgi:hypothetical protein
MSPIPLLSIIKKKMSKIILITEASIGFGKIWAKPF